MFEVLKDTQHLKWNIIYLVLKKKIEKRTFWKLSPCAQEQFLGFGTSSQNNFFILQRINKALELENIHTENVNS